MGEVVVVLILCLPLPHAIRGLILKGFEAFEESYNVLHLFHQLMVSTADDMFISYII
jgi:hypothetical protein